MPETTEHFVVQVYLDGTATIDEERIGSGEWPDGNAAAYGLLAEEAGRRGEPVLVRGIDHRNGTDRWLYVHADATMETAFVGPGAPAEEGTPEPAADLIEQVPGRRSVGDSDAGEYRPVTTSAMPAAMTEPPRPFPGPYPQPGPFPAPEPFPAPVPEPPPVPEPGPTPEPMPEPEPFPQPEPLPGPEREPFPKPVPQPFPHPGPGPEPEPFPRPEPVPGPEPEPFPQPEPVPGPRPEPPAPQGTSSRTAARPAIALDLAAAPTRPRRSPSGQRAPQQRTPSRPFAQPDDAASRAAFIRPGRPRPTTGLRAALYTLTGGKLNLGPSERQRQEDDLERRISRQLQGSFNTAILSLKGGIGKTSTTVGVGLTLAQYRGDPPCAIDANPDSGDLAERALGESIYDSSPPKTITDLLANIDSVTSLTALSRYTQHAGRFHLIAGEQDPELSDSLTAEDYLRVRALMSDYYSVLLTDCGTGVTHNAMSGILQSADNLIIAAGYAVSGAKRARNTLLWLANHGYEDLARNAVVVITDKDEVSSRVDKKAIMEHLSGICRELIAVPHDRGVADGDLVSLDALKPATRRAYKEIAAAIVDGYR